MLVVLRVNSNIIEALNRHDAAGDRTLCEVFQVFGVIHQVTTDHATLTRITQEVIEDFAADNVQYLELRTTPKVVSQSHFLSKFPESLGQ